MTISPKGLPRSGGEKNYLEYIYRRPRYLSTCIFTVYLLIMVRYRFVSRSKLTFFFRDRARPTALCLASVRFSSLKRVMFFNLFLRSFTCPKHRTNALQYPARSISMPFILLLLTWQPFEGRTEVTKHTRNVQIDYPRFNYHLWGLMFVQYSWIHR